MANHEKADLRKVLDHYQVTYNASRDRQMVKCPLHEDNTPSMSLNLDRGLWRCHSCGAGGDGFTLIEKVEGIPFVRAAELAATQHLTEGGDGGGDGELSGSAYGRRRHVSRRSRPNGRDGSYRPAWRRD